MFSQTFHVTIILLKQDSKALSPRPLKNAPETFNAKMLLKLLMLIIILKLLMLCNNALEAFNANK